MTDIIGATLQNYNSNVVYEMFINDKRFMSALDVSMHYWKHHNKKSGFTERVLDKLTHPMMELVRQQSLNCQLIKNEFGYQDECSMCRAVNYFMRQDDKTRISVEKFIEYKSIKLVPQRELVRFKKAMKLYTEHELHYDLAVKMNKEYGEATDLYRVYSDDELLYVGISNSWFKRLKQHAKRSGWYKPANTVKIEHFTTRAFAASAESIAIIKENPVFNIQGKVRG